MSQRKVRSLVVSELNRLVEVDLLRNAVTLYQHVQVDQSGDGASYKAQTIVEIPQLVTSRETLAAQLDRFVALATGAADAEVERAGILPSHRVVEALRDAALGATV